MANSNLEIRQLKNDAGEVFVFYRYKDDKNNNFEYQVYKLVESKDVARSFGIDEFPSGRKTGLNSREMCDELFKQKTI